MVPVSYTFRNLVVRWHSTLMTAVGFSLVVAALIVMLAFINGVQRVCVASGEPENVIITDKGNSDEVFSQLQSSQIRELSLFEGVVRDDKGNPLASPEMFTVVHHYSQKSGGFEFLHVRGVSEQAPQVHQVVKLERGRWFRQGQSELIVGSSLAQHQDFGLGTKLRIGANDWTVVGVFSAEGSALESEFWCDLPKLASTFRREGFVSTLVVRSANEKEALRLADSLSTSRYADVEASIEPDYYRKQSEQMNSLIVATWVIAMFMGIGSVFGIMNTMFATITQRKCDISIMRIIGFSKLQILTAFILEAIILASVGTSIGLLAWPLINGISQSAEVGSRELHFTFFLDATTALTIAGFSIFLGVLGGIFPAMSAMRISALEALRS